MLDYGVFPLLAYIDGGSASLFFQALIAGILAAGFMAKTQLLHFLSRLKSLLTRKNPDKS